MKVDGADVRVILNSKAEPTLEVVLTVGGTKLRASAPSGTSAGKHEVHAWPDAESIDEAVVKAAERLRNEVFPEIVGKDLEPKEVDELLENVDGTENFSRIGGNAALATSIAFMKAYAWDQNLNTFEAVAEAYGFKPGPVKPLENLIGGGAHGGGSDVQEFLMAVDLADMRQNIRVLAWAYRELKRMLHDVDPAFKGALTLESAYVSSLDTEDTLSVLAALRDILHEFGYTAEIGMDVAASEMWNGEKYAWRAQGVERTTEEMMGYMEELCKRYDLAYLEDPFHEDDFESFRELQSRVGTTVVGDDLFVTNAGRLVDGVGGIIIKPNQRGTLLRTVETVKEARKRGMKIIVSHRSGETDDEFLAHFAVGVGADYAKIGAAGIRTVKLNELIRISELL